MAEKNSKKKMLLAASVAGLIAVAGSILPATVYAADVACSGVNGCKGMADCGGKAHSCAGQNACKGQGWVRVPSQDLCTKLGGTITEGMMH